MPIHRCGSRKEIAETPVGGVAARVHEDPASEVRYT
jgi:hypothetical protein